MFRNRAEQTGSVVAQEMDRIMGSEDHRAVFHKPDPQVKTAADKSKKDKECKCDGECKCKKEEKSAADQLQLAIKGMSKISESLDNIGLEKSALITLKALDTIVSEAMGLDMSDSCDANYAKDKKDKDGDKEDDEDKEKDEKDDKKDDDKKEDDKKDKDEDKKKDKKDDDDNDADDPLADVEKRMEQERSGLAPGNVIQSGKPQETIPAPPGSGYDRIPAADSNNDEDRRVNHGLMPIEERQKALEYGTPSHPVKGTKPVDVDTEEKHKREYKHPWERDSFEINMADDEKKEEDKEITVEIVDDGEDLRKIMEELGIDLE